MRTTPLPCPPWCALPRGHAFPSEHIGGGDVERFHSRTVASIPLPRPEERVLRTCRVDISQMETAAGPDGPVVQTFPIEIGFWGLAEGDGLTGPQARQVAAALLKAADEWDVIQGPGPS